MQLTIIESPYAGDIETNEAYARECMLDSLYRGEAPYLSHLLYTQVLDDSIPKQRKIGIEAGFAWKRSPDVLTVFYTDLGISDGMVQALNYCDDNNLPYEMRSINHA